METIPGTITRHKAEIISFLPFLHPTPPRHPLALTQIHGLLFSTIVTDTLLFAILFGLVVLFLRQGLIM